MVNLRAASSRRISLLPAIAGADGQRSASTYGTHSKAR